MGCGLWLGFALQHRWKTEEEKETSATKPAGNLHRAAWSIKFMTIITAAEHQTSADPPTVCGFYNWTGGSDKVNMLP